MAPFSLPAPCIIPLRLPFFGGPKSIDSNTKIQLLCETQLDHEVFYTLDGTKPQPYAGIVQGNKTIKYTSPFCLPVGKITIRAISINANIHTICSSVITKCYEVLKAESTKDVQHIAKKKQSKNKEVKNQHAVLEENGKTQNSQMLGDSNSYKFDSLSINNNTNCFDEAFIGGSEFETELSDEDSIEDKTAFPAGQYDDDCESVNSADSGKSENLDVVDNANGVKAAENGGDECVSYKKKMVDSNYTIKSDSAASVDTQFCCIKCDMTLQHCSSCNRMNAVSSKYCIECGKQLALLCLFCKNHNPSVALFCQYCGKKLDSTLFAEAESRLKIDHSVMARPQFKNVGVQQLPAMVDKGIQTNTERSVKNSSPRFQRKHVPRQSPGRGYWHQQLDYICNHLKSHAYNHTEFRKEISEPALCDFKSAHIKKDENNVTVTIIFSPLEMQKNSISASVEINSKATA